MAGYDKGPLAGYDTGLNKHLYHRINLSSPEMDDMASQAPPGASMAEQAQAAGGEDMFRNIQAMREATYKKEVKEGEISSEFSGIRRPGYLSGESSSEFSGIRRPGHLSGLGYWF